MKLEHIKAENICSEKNSFILLPSVSVGCAHWLALFLRSDPTTTTARIDRKAVFTKFFLFKPWSQQNPFLFLKIQASNEIIWFKMRRTDQQTPRRLLLELCAFRFHEIDPSLSTCLRFKTIISKCNRHDMKRNTSCKFVELLHPFTMQLAGNCSNYFLGLSHK